MGPKFINIDRDTPMLLPVDLRDWVPQDHLVRFILEAVETLNPPGFKVNVRGTGSPQYPPHLLLSLLIYCYASGLFSSRQIERATHENLPLRFLCANTHPDHDTICTFRRENHTLFKAAFVQVLELARRLKVLKVGQITVAHDGTKVQANASKHSAVSYERAGEMIQPLDLEVEQLMAKAEAADSPPLQDGLSIPEEIVRRRERKAQLEQARAEMEARAQQRAQEQQPDYEQKVARRQAQREQGQKPRGSEPQPPSAVPEPKDQYNFTDPESRIMKAGNGSHFEQAYNAQASVEVDSRLIVGQSVSDQANDKQQLVPAVKIVQDNVGAVAAALVDSGFYSETAVQQVETNAAGQPTGTTVYAAVEKTGHHRTVEDLEQKETPAAPGAEAGTKAIMAHRLRTPEGKELYGLRKETVEPVFGIIKAAMGFRRFSLRGKAKVALEWTLVTLSYNLRRLHTVLQSRNNAEGMSQTSPNRGQPVMQEEVFAFGVVRYAGEAVVRKVRGIFPAAWNALTTASTVISSVIAITTDRIAECLSPTCC